MSDDKTTVGEMLESLTGFEEIAISKQFDADIATLLATQATMAGRALVFIDQKRQGLSDSEAKKVSMEMTLKAVDGYFAEDEDAAVPEEPVTEAGKDDWPDG